MNAIAQRNTFEAKLGRGIAAVHFRQLRLRDALDAPWALQAVPEALRSKVPQPGPLLSRIDFPLSYPAPDEL